MINVPAGTITVGSDLVDPVTTSRSTAPARARTSSTAAGSPRLSASAATGSAKINRLHDPQRRARAAASSPGRQHRQPGRRCARPRARDRRQRVQRRWRREPHGGRADDRPQPDRHQRPGGGVLNDRRHRERRRPRRTADRRLDDLRQHGRTGARAASSRRNQDPAHRAALVTFADNTGGARAVGGVQLRDRPPTRRLIIASNLARNRTGASATANCGGDRCRPTAAPTSSDRRRPAASRLHRRPRPRRQLTDAGGDDRVLPLAATSPAVDRSGRRLPRRHRPARRGAPAGRGVRRRRVRVRRRRPPADADRHAAAHAADAHADADRRPRADAGRAGKSVVAAPVSGKVLVKLPGANTFVALDPSVIKQRRRGRHPQGHGRDHAAPTAAQRDVLRRHLQAHRSPAAITTLTLTEKLPAARRPSSRSAAAKKPKTRKLWGDGKGKFRTNGQYSAATVRGTKWLVQDALPLHADPGRAAAS